MLPSRHLLRAGRSITHMQSWPRHGTFRREETEMPAATEDPVLAVRHSVLAERIQQLNDRTRICTRKVWEEMYLADLRGGAAGADEMRESLETCTICMANIADSDRVRGLACGHIFHLPCLAEWFTRDRTFELCCPLCRVPLSKQPRFRDFD